MNMFYMMTALKYQQLRYILGDATVGVKHSIYKFLLPISLRVY